MGKKSKSKKKQKQNASVPAVEVNPRKQTTRLLMIPRFRSTVVINEGHDPLDSLLQLMISESNFSLTEDDLEQIPGRPKRPTGLLATAAAHLIGHAGQWTKVDEYALSTEEETGFLWITCCWNDRPPDTLSQDHRINEWIQEPGAQIAGNTYCWRKPFLLFLLNKNHDEYCSIDKETIPKISFVTAQECNRLSQKITTPGWIIGRPEGEGTQQRCVRDGCPSNSNHKFIEAVILCRCKSKTYCSIDCRNMDKHDCIKPETTECPICCDPLIDSHSQLLMCKNCSNQYHKDCIKPWIEKNSTCPLCRFDWNK